MLKMKLNFDLVSQGSSCRVRKVSCSEVSGTNFSCFSDWSYIGFDSSVWLSNSAAWQAVKFMVAFENMLHCIVF